MIIKLLYVLFFVGSNFIIYSYLHRTGIIKLKGFIIFLFLLLVALIMHISIPDNGILISRDLFLSLFYMFALPVMAHFWFKFQTVKRITRLKERGVNERFLNTAAKIFSFFFLKITYLMAVITQIVFVCSPTALK